MGVWVSQLTDQLPILAKMQNLLLNLGFFLKIVNILSFLDFLGSFY